MIGTWTVVGIRHLTHNQVVAGSSPAGPGTGGLTLTEGIINMFDEFTRSKVYDDIWYTDSMYGRIELREESMFMEIVDQMAEENEIMSYGRGLLKETGYLPPSFIVDYFANIREFNMERPEQKIFYILLIADSYYRYN